MHIQGHMHTDRQTDRQKHTPKIHVTLRLPMGGRPVGSEPVAQAPPPSGSSRQRCRAVGCVVTVAPERAGLPSPITLPKDRGFQKHT